MADQNEDDPVILQEGKPADEKFRFNVEKHVLGRKIQAMTYCSNDDVNGEPKTTIRFDFDDGGFLVLAIGVDTGANIDIWVSAKDQPEPISKFVM